MLTSMSDSGNHLKYTKTTTVSHSPEYDSRYNIQTVCHPIVQPNCESERSSPGSHSTSYESCTKQCTLTTVHKRRSTQKSVTNMFLLGTSESILDNVRMDNSLFGAELELLWDFVRAVKTVTIHLIQTHFHWIWYELALIGHLFSDSSGWWTPVHLCSTRSRTAVVVSIDSIRSLSTSDCSTSWLSLQTNGEIQVGIYSLLVHGFRVVRVFVCCAVILSSFCFVCACCER